MLIAATLLKEDQQDSRRTITSITIAGRFGTAIFECSGSAAMFLSSELLCLRCSRWRSGYIYIYNTSTYDAYIYIYTHTYI